MTLKVGQLVKFTANARYKEWNKQELAEITDILVTFPDNQTTLYMVRPHGSNTQFWVYEAEITPTFEQLTLF